LKKAKEWRRSFRHARTIWSRRRADPQSGGADASPWERHEPASRR
jgi:hypothetical protein